MSCDNLPHNGARLRDIVLTLADARGEGLAALAACTGLDDRAMVKTEPFWQWVVEDRFAGPRPPFEAFGVEVTDSVADWETAKLRLLNGAHSAMAYLGGLGGLAFVHEFVAEPALARFVEGLWDEAAATLPAHAAVDTAAYRKNLMARFGNAALQHRLAQIAMDGSQKLPPRILSSVQVRLERGQPFPRPALAIAAWMGWQTGRDEAGHRFEIEDPLAVRTTGEAALATSPEDLAHRLLALRDIFPAALADHPAFQVEVLTQLDALHRLGALEAARRLIRA